MPLGLPGRVFRRAMPFSAHDPAGAILAAHRAQAVSLVVLLAEAEECLRDAACHLPVRYEEKGVGVLQEEFVRRYRA